jgi:hypothetical protein
MVFNATFTHLFQLYLAVSFIGGGNRRKPEETGVLQVTDKL